MDGFVAHYFSLIAWQAIFAFNRYGFDEQIPTRLYAYNDKISGNFVIGKVELSLIKVQAKRLGDAEAFLDANVLLQSFQTQLNDLETMQ